MSVLQVATERDGQVLRLTLARPKANVLDAELVGALRGALPPAPARGPLKLVILDHLGPHFSFGASVEEHLPGRVGEMLASFHGLFRALDALGVPLAAVVRGQCLGGGLELALLAGRVFVDRTAILGVPEVRLGVFPPVGALLLPFRVSMAEATRLVTSGRTVTGPEAVALGLADDLADDPAAACLAWFDESLAPHSAVAVRHAWRAVREPISRALRDDLAALERRYLEELMSHEDPVIGLTAFLGRQTPAWVHA